MVGALNSTFKQTQGFPTTFTQSRTFSLKDTSKTLHLLCCSSDALPPLYKLLPFLLDVWLSLNPAGKPGTCSGEPWLEVLVLYLSH